MNESIADFAHQSLGSCHEEADCTHGIDRAVNWWMGWLVSQSVLNRRCICRCWRSMGRTGFLLFWSASRRRLRERPLSTQLQSSG